MANWFERAFLVSQDDIGLLQGLITELLSELRSAKTRTVGARAIDTRGPRVDQTSSKGPVCEQRLLDEKATARYLSLSRSTLRQMRMEGRKRKTAMLPYVRFGRSIRYRIEDLDDWIGKNFILG